MPAGPRPSFNPADQDLLRRLRTLAEEAARTGGKLARAAFCGSFSVRRKPDGTEVTSADEAAQNAIVEFLCAERPGDAFITEEDSAPCAMPRRSAGMPPSKSPGVSDSTAASASSQAPTNDIVCWVIDPLDGTRNFVYGVPLYAVSVAAMLGGFPIVGAVYLPERDELYAAGGPDGLLLNGRPPPAARPSPPPRSGGRPPKPLVGIPNSFQGGAFAVMQYWGVPGGASPGVVVRNTGSTAMHLAMVAAGQLQAALISDSRLWDIAAGWLLVTAAGGVMTGLEGQDIFPLDVARYAGEALPSLASANPELHELLLPKQ